MIFSLLLMALAGPKPNLRTLGVLDAKWRENPLRDTVDPVSPNGRLGEIAERLSRICTQRLGEERAPIGDFGPGSLDRCQSIFLPYHVLF